MQDVRLLGWSGRGAGWGPRPMESRSAGVLARLARLVQGSALGRRVAAPAGGFLSSWCAREREQGEEREKARDSGVGFLAADWRKKARGAAAGKGAGGG